MAIMPMFDIPELDNVIAGGIAPKPEGAATPVLSSLSPNTGVCGAPDMITMSCIGSGFTEASVIVFGDYDEPTTFVSDTEVTTGVTQSLFVNPAVVPVKVRNGDVYSESVDFTFTAS